MNEGSTLGWSLVAIAWGTSMISIGIAIKAGWWRTWYFKRDIPVFAPKRSLYGSIPIGIMMFLIGVSVFLPAGLGRVLTIRSIQVGIVSAVLLGIFRPRWLKPHWLQQLEAKHADILDIIIAETRRERQLHGEDWFRWACSDEGLDKWVAEVRQRYRLQRMGSWFDTLDLRYPHLDFETLVKVLGDAAGQEDTDWAQQMQTEEDITRWAEKVLQQRGLLD